jgi:hypothetical protein
VDFSSIERAVKTLCQQTAAFITNLATFLSYVGRPQYSRATPPGHGSNRNQTETFLTSRTKETEGVLNFGRKHEIGYAPRTSLTLR